MEIEGTLKESSLESKGNLKESPLECNGWLLAAGYWLLAAGCWLLDLKEFHLESNGN